MSIDIKNIYCRHWIKNSSLNKLLDNIEYIKDGEHIILSIRDSIHYRSLLNNDYTLYNEYISITNQKEHSIENFKKIKDTFDIKKIGNINLLYVNKYKRYILQDGLHRTALLLYNNINSIKLINLNIKYDDNTINNIKDKLKNTVGNNHYNGWYNRTVYGYHSFNIYNINIIGQRNPLQRINLFRKYISFENKKVIDFGCNNGGILFHLPEISFGIGYDYDEKCINFANNLSKILNYNNTLKFIQKDLNNFNLLKDQDINNQKIDIIFLLSLGSWVKNWKTLYINCLNKTEYIILETNNDKEGKSQLELFRNKGCKIEMIIDNSKDDITGNNRRKSYLIYK